MEKIYSRIQPSILLHLIHRAEDFTDGRLDLVPADNSMQLATISLSKGQTFKAHKHNYSPRITYTAQECWVVVKGKVRVFYYDMDDLPLGNFDLLPGDITCTLAASHNYESLEPSLVYELKAGQYLGQVVDKSFL